MANQKLSKDGQKQEAGRRNSRRGFLRAAGGVAAGTALFMAGCDGDAVPENGEPTGSLAISGLDDDDLSVTFDVTLSDPDGDDGDVDAVLRFGDGESQRNVSNGDSITHMYPEVGEYNVELRVRDEFSGFSTADSQTIMVGMETPMVTLDFSTNAGVLNYAYALEQLEAAFYERAVQAIDDGDLDLESTVSQYMSDLAAHEGIHRDFLAAALSSDRVDGEPISLANFLDLESVVDFGNRSSVLGTAQLLEDTGVSAYNGAGIYLEDDFLTLAGKIVSVEGRHAAAIRAINNDSSTAFADLSDLTDLGANTSFSLGVAQSPDTVLNAVASTGLVTGVQISASGLVDNPNTN